ncbi:hypothetical protein E6R27_17135 [Providencia sp. MGF014]|nr:hypothetical protein E6R27_17135 [Providencia sp. MGF014]
MNSVYNHFPIYRGRSSSPVRRLDFKSSWGCQQSRAGSTPVIFRQTQFLNFSQSLYFPFKSTRLIT